MARAFTLSALVACCAIAIPCSAQQPSTGSAGAKADSCGRADPSYLRTATETGGQPLFFKRSEAGRVGQFIRELSGNNRETLLWATGAFHQSPRQFTVAADSAIHSLTFSLSVDGEGSAMTVFRPSGAPVHARDGDVEVTELVCTRIITIATPEAGEWRADITGAGHFWFQAGAKTDIFFVRVEFVTAGGRPGHQGLFRIRGQPLAGSPAMLQAKVSGPIETAAFRLVTLDGETARTIVMAQASAGGDDHEYIGTFEPPRQPFRIAVHGVDTNGRPYQRVFHTLFHAETVEILPGARVPERVLAGATTSVTFTVHNVGQPAAFRILVVDSRQFVSRIEPREITLGTGASGVVTVDLSPPADLPATTASDLTVTATSSSPASTTNGTSVHIEVISARKP